MTWRSTNTRWPRVARSSGRRSWLRAACYTPPALAWLAWAAVVTDPARAAIALVAMSTAVRFGGERGLFMSLIRPDAPRGRITLSWNHGLRAGLLAVPVIAPLLVPDLRMTQAWLLLVALLFALYAAGKVGCWHAGCCAWRVGLPGMWPPRQLTEAAAGGALAAAAVAMSRDSPNSLADVLLCAGLLACHLGARGWVRHR